MVHTASYIFKRFFYKIEPSKPGIFRSGGLAFVFCWIHSIGFFKELSAGVKDRRISKKVSYTLDKIVLFIIMMIMDGDLRLSHYDRNPNSALLKRLFGWQSIITYSTVLKTLQRNRHLSWILNRFLLKMGIKEVIRYCHKNNRRKVTIDVDQSARVIHGKQQLVGQGYSAGKRNARLYQIRVWAVREIKQALRLRLMSGSAHSGNGFLSEIKLIASMLKKAGITGVFVGDSGFVSGAVCDFLEEAGHKFIFAVPQYKSVKRRGKYSKNKKHHYKGSIQIKERKRPVTNRFNHQFREIYVKVLSPDGQLWFDFAADHFTNVFVTNTSLSALNVYKCYRKHAVIETVIEELKNDFGAGLAHCNDFRVNSIMTTCTGIAYNIKNRFLVDAGFAKDGEPKEKASTFRARWLHTPGEIVRRSNRYILKIAPARYDKFKQFSAA